MPCVKAAQVVMHQGIVAFMAYLCIRARVLLRGLIAQTLASCFTSNTACNVTRFTSKLTLRLSRT
jgi:hypothetical protein